MKPRTFRAEREFGLIVGAIFSLLGWWWIYRGKFPAAAYLFKTLGWTLIVLGLFFPRLLATPHKIWIKLAEGMAYVSSSKEHRVSCDREYEFQRQR